MPRKKTEEELQLKRLREMANAILASSAYSLKQEEKQLERIMNQLKDVESAHEAGLFSAEELEEKRRSTDEELAIVRRVWSLRRVIAKKLVDDMKGVLDALESKYPGEGTA